MKAVCAVYSDPGLRFTINHCEQFLHLGLKEGVYPYGIVPEGVGWGWYVLHFNGVWKALPQCGYLVEDSVVQGVIESGLVGVVTQDWKHPATGKVFRNCRILTQRRKRVPYVFDRRDWQGKCLRCGICCSVPRRKTGKACEYLAFVEE